MHQRARLPATNAPASTAAVMSLQQPISSQRERSADDEVAQDALMRRMESAFRFSFADVRIRADETAARRAASLGARAYAVGREIGFAAGAYQPARPEGLRLLAHELAHVVQARGGSGGVPVAARLRPGELRRSPEHGAAEDELERDADEAAEDVLAGRVPEIAPGELGSTARKPTHPKGPPAAPARGTATLFVSGHQHIYTFHSADVTEWHRSGQLARRIFAHHLTHAYAGATAAMAAEFPAAKLKLDLPAWFVAGAGKYATRPVGVPFAIRPELRDEVVAWVKKQHPELAEKPLDASPRTVSDDDPSKDQEPKAAQDKVNARVVYVAPELKEHADALLALLRELFRPPSGPPDPKAPAPPPLYVDARLAELLLKISKSPNKAAILARLKGDGPTKGRAEELSDVLETALAQQDIEEARGRLETIDDVADRKSQAAPSAEEPIERRPVRGQIVNTAGRLVANRKATFLFEVTHERDALRVPHIHIRWVAYPRGKPQKASWVGSEITRYIPTRNQGLVNDKIFDLTFNEPGNYTIEAFVAHNYFLPAHFVQEVQVWSEEGLTRELEKDALRGFVKSETRSEQRVFTSGPYGKGTVAYGELDPDQEPVTLAQRLLGMKPERERVVALIKAYEGSKTREALAVVSWARDYLKSLDNAQKELSAEAAKPGAVPLGVRGVYVNRTQDVPSRQLDLVAYVRRPPPRTDSSSIMTEPGSLTARPFDYEVTVHDMTRLFEPENYQFFGGADSFENACQKAFLDQASSYPDGTLTVTFQRWDDKVDRPGTTYVRFSKVTDSVGKKIKSVVFDTAVDMAVNFAAVALMVVPGLQPLGIGVGIAYNTAKLASSAADEMTRGTFTTEKQVLSAGMLALNLLPLAGRGAKLVTIGGTTFHTVEAVSVGGALLLLSAQGMHDVGKLRTGVIAELAKVDEEIKSRRRVNASDPELPALEERKRQLIKEGEAATFKVFTQLAATQGMFLLGGAVVRKLVEARVAARAEATRGAPFGEPSGRPEGRPAARRTGVDEHRAALWRGWAEALDFGSRLYSFPLNPLVVFELVFRSRKAPKPPSNRRLIMDYKERVKTDPETSRVDPDKLTPPQQKAIKEAYDAAKNEVDGVVKHGKAQGLQEDEIDAAFDKWASTEPRTSIETLKSGLTPGAPAAAAPLRAVHPDILAHGEALGMTDAQILAFERNRTQEWKTIEHHMDGSGKKIGEESRFVDRPEPLPLDDVKKHMSEWAQWFKTYSAAEPEARVPLGFKDAEHFKAFKNTSGRVNKVDPYAEVYVQGSAISGLSYEKKIPFGKHSDIDVAIVSEALFKKAVTVNVPGTSKMRGPLNSDHLEALGLWNLADRLERAATGNSRKTDEGNKRKVKADNRVQIAIFPSLEAAQAPIGNAQGPRDALKITE